MIIHTLLQMNLLLLVAGLFWRGLTFVLEKSGWKASQQFQLKLMRWLFAGVFALPLVAYLLGQRPLLTGMEASWPIVTATAPLAEQTIDNARGWPRAAVIFLSVTLAIVALAACLYLLQQWLRVRRVVSDGTVLRSMGTLRIIIAEQLHSPFSTKVLGKSHIVIPLTMLNDPARLRIAIAHEGQHHRNGDLWWIIALELLCKLFFYNPAIYWWRATFQQQQEFACDETLVQQRKVNPNAYGNCLLDLVTGIAVRRQPGLGCSNMAAPRRLNFFTLHNPIQPIHRRVIMLTTITTHTEKRFTSGLLTGIVSVFGLALASLSILSTQALAAEDPAHFEALNRTPPVYPVQAREQNQEGWVVVEFTIRADGTTANLTAVEECMNNGQGVCESSEVFTRAALNAVSNWRYKPKMQNGNAVAVSGVQTKLTFALGSNAEI